MRGRERVTFFEADVFANTKQARCERPAGASWRFLMIPYAKNFGLAQKSFASSLGFVYDVPINTGRGANGEIPKLPAPFYALVHIFAFMAGLSKNARYLSPTCLYKDEA